MSPFISSPAERLQLMDERRVENSVIFFYSDGNPVTSGNGLLRTDCFEEDLIFQRWIGLKALSIFFILLQ